jgi:Ser/Thr protein kinase RdoA (MazF antagonist)
MTDNAAGPNSSHPYEALDPDTLLSAVESFGLRCDGRILPLNSYENRVYQLGLEQGGYVVAKFYRPERWSDAVILEEHAFTLELASAEIPAVVPLRSPAGETLANYAGFRFAVYERIGGRAPELDDPNTLLTLGRTVARIHAIGALRPFRHRPTLSVREMGQDSYQYLLNEGFVPREFVREYRAAAEEVLALVESEWNTTQPRVRLRVHGDCHPGNILWTPTGPFVVDFDDCRNGPAVQDLWMFLSGDCQLMTWQMAKLLAGYREFHDFSISELRLIEPLRSLRMLHYCAWLARRWGDPAFPRHFPWFATAHYWREQIVGLQEQVMRMQEEPIDPFGLDD